MQVHELRTVLDHLPPTLDVHIEAGGSCVQIDTVDRRNGRWSDTGVWPGAVVLRGRRVWYHDEVPFHLKGRFRDKPDLVVKLLLGPPPKTRQRRST